MEYLGHLSKNDPLYSYLADCIMPQTGACGAKGFRVFASHSSHTVYIYEDRATMQKVVGKFFAADEKDFEHAKHKMYREYNNINEFSNYLGNNHYAAKALGCNESLGCLLVSEYCFGEPLTTVIENAINQHDNNLLFRKLTALGKFMATVHNRSALPVMVDFQKICRYFHNLVKQLHGLLENRKIQYLHDLCNEYQNDILMYQDQEVLVHGDATPANFFFGDGMYVITFDLERMQRSDRLFDVGRIAGELKHFFLFHCHDKYASEPFIGHFLWEYCCHFPDRDRAFKSITARAPFYIGMTLLRIARNNYLPYNYRRMLVDEAESILKRS